MQLGILHRIRVLTATVHVFTWKSTACQQFYVLPLNMADRRPCEWKYFMCFFHVSELPAIQSLGITWLLAVLHLLSVPLASLPRKYRPQYMWYGKLPCSRILLPVEISMELITELGYLQGVFLARASALYPIFQHSYSVWHGLVCCSSVVVYFFINRVVLS
jgi:hypothetical protein